MARLQSHEHRGGHEGEPRKEGIKEDVRRQYTQAAHRRAELGTKTASRHERLHANPTFDPESNLKAVLREIPRLHLASTDAAEKLLAKGYEEKQIEGLEGFGLLSVAKIDKTGKTPRNAITGFITALTYQYNDVLVACKGRDDEGHRTFGVYVKGRKG